MLRVHDDGAFDKLFCYGKNSRTLIIAGVLGDTIAIGDTIF